MKLYGVTQHAIERAVERLEKPRKQAHNYLNQLMQSAVYVGTNGDGRIFDHYTSRTRIILDKDKDKIVTVYSMDTVKDAPQAQPSNAHNGILSEVIRATVERELRKASVTFRRTYRQFTLKLADVNLEIAELFRNKVRCKHPGTQSIIQAQIDALEDEARAIQNAMQTQESEYRAIEQEASVYLRTDGELVSQ